MTNKKKEIKKVVGYVRVSTKNQAEEGYSIEAQKQSIKDWVKKEKHKLLKIFADEGRTATNASRPEFKEMLDYCLLNDVSACIVYHTDRFARNELIHALYKKELKENGVELISITQPMIDSSPEGFLLDGVLANLNAYYSRDLGRKTKKGLMRKWESGGMPGPSPIGYKNVKKTKDAIHKTTIPDKTTAPLIQEMFRLYSTGQFSITRLREVFNQKGLKSKNDIPLNDSAVHKILCNEFYYGRMHWSDLTKMGNHKPLINKELFESCKYVRAKHRQFLIRRRKHFFLLCSYVYCGDCGRRLTAEWHKIQSKKRDKIAYYHCTRKGGCYSKYSEKEDLEQKVANLIKKFQFSDDFIKLVKKKAIEAVKNTRSTTQSSKRALQNQLNALEAKRETIEDKFCNGDIEKEVYQRQHIKTQSEIDNINQKLLEVEDKHRIDFNIIEEVLNMTRNIYKTYLDAPDFIKQYYLRFFFERIEIKNTKVVKFIPTPTFKVLLEGQQVLNSSHRLEGRNLNITSQLTSIINVFKDFKLMQDLREEINQVKPRLAL